MIGDLKSALKLTSTPVKGPWVEKYVPYTSPNVPVSGFHLTTIRLDASISFLRWVTLPSLVWVLAACYSPIHFLISMHRGTSDTILGLCVLTSRFTLSRLVMCTCDKARSK